MKDIGAVAPNSQDEHEQWEAVGLGIGKEALDSIIRIRLSVAAFDYETFVFAEFQVRIRVKDGDDREYLLK